MWFWRRFFFFLCFDHLIWTWTWTWTRTSLDSDLTRTRTSLDLDLTRTRTSLDLDLSWTRQRWTWLQPCLPRCFSDTGLFGKNALQLPLKSINLGYKQEKTHLVFELKESRDEAVKRTGVTIRTGHRWRAQQEVDQAVNRLQHKEVMGRVQHS